MQITGKAIQAFSNAALRHPVLKGALLKETPRVLVAGHPPTLAEFTDATPLWVPDGPVVVLTREPLDLTWPARIREHAALFVTAAGPGGLRAVPATYHSARGALRLGPFVRLAVLATEGPHASGNQLELRVVSGDPTDEWTSRWMTTVLSAGTSDPATAAKRVQAGIDGAITHVHRMLWLLTKAMHAHGRKDEGTGEVQNPGT